MKMKKIVWLLLLLTWMLPAQNTDLFEEANTQYSEGNYEESVNLYEQIIENGEASVAVYYNLANAHYKLNNVAPSIYYFEKALQLAPGDEDVQNNIEFARNMTIDDIPEQETTGLTKRLNELISIFSYNTWGKISIAFSILFAITFLAYYFNVGSRKKRFFFGVSVLLLLLGVSSVYFAFKQQQIQKNNRFAIVYVEEAEVRDEPTAREEAAFNLHEGTKTKLLENYQGWVKIELADGTQGWISGEDIRKL